MKCPTKSQLITALDKAGALHHSYEEVHLGGKRDEYWSGFYAAYVLGRYGEFLKAAVLAAQLEKVPVSANWSRDAAETILEIMGLQEGTADQQGRGELIYVCPHCFTATDAPGKCPVCGYQVHEFHPGDVDDPCRCPVINERGEVVTHAPLWWLRSVAPELAKRMEDDRTTNKPQ